jgi:hypothetical protein
MNTYTYRTSRDALFDEAFALLQRAQELLLAAREKHEQQVKAEKRAA